ncbi:MAG: hypothetical protein PHW07_05585 [Sulfurospirillaceae bacterium]|nr:hypothetical protein [Sulfurospirillaceae bacterium]
MKRFYKILFFEFVVIALIAGYFLVDSADIYRWWVGETKLTGADFGCDLHQESCEVTLKDGSTVLFSITPKSIPLMEKLTFRAETKNINESCLELKLFATNMNMGLHSFKMLKKEDGVYEAQGILPTCIVGGMIWQANVIINKPSESIGAFYRFKTK